MSEDGPVVVLAGGTGGAKLARGMLDVVDHDDLVVVANTGDDVEIYGAYVSPDPDLVSFWLADRIDERGWGLKNDTFAVMAGLADLGIDIWFHLGDRDLAIGLQRARALDDGVSLTAAHARVTAALGVRARVLPMSDKPVRTRILAGGTWWALQEFLIKHGGQGPVQDVNFRNSRAAPPTPEVLEAIVNARTIILGPSNPVISIGPILALPGLREAIRESSAPVVAVSPLVAGRAVKGPTEACLRWLGQPLTPAGIVGAYDGLLDGLVADDGSGDLPVLQTDVLMDGAQGRRRLAEQTLEFALGLA